MNPDESFQTGIPACEIRALFAEAAVRAGVIRPGDPIDQMQVDFATEIITLCARVYVPRVDHHLMIDGPVIRSTRGPKECRARPAINVLFRSVAESCGSRAIGVILSGMLDDGTAGLWEIK